VSASAQVYVNGQPLISTGTTVSGADSDAAYIDAFVFSSSGDMCARISAAWTQVLVTEGYTSATVDARGFTGNQTCALGPYNVSGKTPHGILLLGDVSIATSVTWVVPTQSELRGIGHGGAYGAPSGYNTIISAASTGGFTLASNEPVVQMGTNGSGNGPWFGVKIDDLTVDCHGQTGCTGIFNNESEENSSVENVQIWDAAAYGLHVSTYDPGNSASPGAVNSGPYRDIYIAYSSNCTITCHSGTVGIEIDGLGSTNNGKATRAFDAITVTGHGSGTPYLSTGVVICGVSTAFTNSHIEFVTTGIEIGAGGGCSTGTTGFDTRNVQVSNVTIGTLSGQSNQVAVMLGATGNSPLTGDVIISGINNGGSSSKTLVDNVTGVTNLTFASDPFLGFYAVGHCPSTGCGTSYPALITTSPTVGWQEPNTTMKKLGGSFSIDHPLDPKNQFLNHSFVESPDMMNIYNGTVTTDKHGVATVILPAYFEALNQDFRYQLTPVGQFAQAFVAERVKGNRFVIKTNKPGVEVSWQVTGIRHDAYANEHRIKVEEPKPLSLREH
jgi:hypothetical protein